MPGQVPALPNPDDPDYLKVKGRGKDKTVTFRTWMKDDVEALRRAKESADFIDASRYGFDEGNRLFAGEIGRYQGVRLIVDSREGWWEPADELLKKASARVLLEEFDAGKG